MGECPGRPEPVVIRVENLEHVYDGRRVLQLPAWELAAGEPCLILGASGSGKTTLLHLLAGLLRPTRGRIFVAGQELGALTPDAMDRFRGARIGFVPQRFRLLGSLSVMDNVLLAQHLGGARSDPARVRQVLEGLGLGDRRNAHPHTLSHGQAQRVAVARALINRPPLLLADEPTSNLDDANAAQVLALLREQAAAVGATLVIATHDGRIRDAVPHRLELKAGAAEAVR